MRNVKSLLFVLGFASLSCMYQSCSEGGSASVSNLSKHVPSNSTFVMMINMGDLLTKMDYEAFKETTYFQDRLAELDSSDVLLAQFMDDPRSLGIDMDGEMVVSVVFEDEINDAEAYLMAGIADMEKASSLIEKMTEMEGITKVDSAGITLYTDGMDRNVANNDKMIVLSSSANMATLSSIFNPTDGGVASNADFQKHYKEGKDVMAWINTTPVVNLFFDSEDGKMSKGMLQMSQIDPNWMLDNYISFYYDFLNGEIEAGTSFDMNEDLRSEFGAIFPDKLNIDFSSMMPSEDMIMAMTMGVNVEAILKELEKRGFLMMMEPAVQSATGYSVTELNEMIGGDLGVAVYAENEMSIPSILAIMSIGDKSTIEELVRQLEGMGAMVSQEGDNWTIALGPQQIMANLNDERIIISNSKTIFDKALAGTSNEMVAQVQNGWMGYHLDLVQAEKAAENNVFIQQMNLDESFGPIFESGDFKSIMMYAKGGDMVGKTYMKNDAVNSLKKLIEYGEKVHVMNKKMMEEFMQEFGDEFDDYSEMEDEMDDLEVEFETL